MPLNMAPPTAYGDQYYCGTPVPYGDPALVAIWEAAARSMIETYPEADAYGIYTTEHHLPVSDAPTRQLLKQHAAVRKQIPSPEELQRQGFTGPSSPEDLESDQAMAVVTG